MKNTMPKAEFSSTTAVQHGLLYGAFGPLLGYAGSLGYDAMNKALQAGSFDVSIHSFFFIGFLPFAYFIAYIPAFLTGYVTSYFLQQFRNPWLLTIVGMAIGAVLAGAGGWLLSVDPNFMSISGGFAAAVITCFFAVTRLHRTEQRKPTPE